MCPGECIPKIKGALISSIYRIKLEGNAKYKKQTSCQGEGTFHQLSTNFQAEELPYRI
jgi:hypothetical protein